MLGVDFANNKSAIAWGGFWYSMASWAEAAPKTKMNNKTVCKIVFILID
jgi:hypothetical protein